MEYVLRSKDGLLKARFGQRVAASLIVVCDGYFRNIQYKGKKPQKAFEVTEPASLTNTVCEGDVQWFLWEGDIITTFSEKGL